MRKVQERGNELATVLISTYLRDLVSFQNWRID